MNKNAGFTLIEVLIAMLVLAVGLLGLAGLQAASLKNNQSTYNRSQAIQLTYDLADRMRANVAGAATYTAILPSAATEKANCLTTIGCTLADMAENDLYEWNNTMNSLLPSSTGTITVITDASTTPPSTIFTVTITWDDNRDGNIDSNDPNFQTSFQL